MFHVHVENASSLMPVFQVREDQYEKALARHPDVAKAIRTTWGRDQDNWAENAKTANIASWSESGTCGPSRAVTKADSIAQSPKGRPTRRFTVFCCR